MTTAAANRSRYIPWLFVLGFTVVVAVNATMVWLAVGSFSGLYTPKPRDRGLRFNDVVAAQQVRDTLGWRIDATWRPGSDRLDIALFDRDGAPLSDARVTVELVRPTEKRPPLGIAMAVVEAGRHAGYATLPARGNWDLDITVERGGQRFAQTRRMFLE